MKNILLYYLAIILPIPFLIRISYSDNSLLFTLFILTYFIPYRTLIDGWRLTSKKVLRWKEIWKLWIPWKFGGYIKDLYFRR